MTKYKSKSASEKREEIDKLVNMISTGTDEFIRSGRFTKILDNLSQFHQYSYNNSLLILLQKPEASYVASYANWKTKFNRQVNNGEKGIQIFFPVKYHVKTEESTDNNLKAEEKIEVTEEKEDASEKTRLGFKIGYVFDISQTSQIAGKEVIELSPVKVLEGSIDKYKDFIKAIREVSPVPVEMTAIRGEVNGYFDSVAKMIAIKEGMSEKQTIKTGIHELTHAILHADTKKNDEMGFSRADKEIQAESTAYVVSKHFGIDTADYSFGYVASWAGDPERIKNNLEVVRDASDRIITEMEDSLMRIQSEKESEVKKMNTEELAKALDGFVKELDPYEYADTENYSGENYSRIFSEVMHGRMYGYREYLEDVIKEDDRMDIKERAESLMQSINMYVEDHAEEIEMMNECSRSRMRF